MKQSELQPCAICGKGVCHAGDPCCMRLDVTRMVTNVGAVQRQTGLEMMLGNAALAAVMGTDEDMLVALGKPVTLLICDKCMSRPIYEVMEAMSRREEAATP